MMEWYIGFIIKLIMAVGVTVGLIMLIMFITSFILYVYYVILEIIDKRKNDEP